MVLKTRKGGWIESSVSPCTGLMNVKYHISLNLSHHQLQEETCITKKKKKCVLFKPWYSVFSLHHLQDTS